MFTDTPLPVTPPPAKVTARPAVDYPTFVLQFARQMTRLVILAFAGVALIVGGAMYTEGAAMVIILAVGLGLAAGGVTGAAAAVGAHASYSRLFGRIETTHYPEPTPPAPAVRPFVASRNYNDGHTIRAGRFSLPPATWRALFDSAASTGGRLTRDGAAQVLPRALYRQWAETLTELQRLGLVDDEARPTAAAWQMVGRPYPTASDAPTGAPSTHARRTHGTPGLDLARAGEGD